MQKIVPFLWFDTETEEAAQLYTSLFKNSSIVETSYYGEGTQRPAGSVLVVNFDLEGQRFGAINAGPQFTPNPAISFFVTLESEAEVDKLWKKLSEGGAVLMPLQSYDWSEKYGWLSDRYGVSWQLSLGKRSGVGQAIVPSLLFVGKQFGRAEEAVRFYTSLFEDSSLTHLMHADAEQTSLQHAQFVLAGQTFTAMDSGLEHDFSFNEAISLLVNCDTQEEVDHFWNALSAQPEAEQCGWLKDRFGVSWQIVPTVLSELMQDPDPQKARRVTEALMGMKKLEIAGLQQAYDAA